MHDGVIRITVANFIIVTLMATFGIVVFKLVTARYMPNSGLTHTVANA